MLDCERSQELISMYIDGEISDAELFLLREHLSTCQECSRLLHVYTEISLAAAEEAEAPEGLAAAVMAGVKKINAEKAASKKRSRTVILRWAAAAASVALISFAGLRLMNGIEMTSPAGESADPSAAAPEKVAPHDGFIGKVELSESEFSRGDSFNPFTPLDPPSPRVDQPNHAGPVNDEPSESSPSTDRASYEFASYAAVSAALTAEETGSYKAIRSEIGKYGEAYGETLEAFSEGEIALMVPAVSGQDMALRSKEGYSTVSLFTKEAYSLPCLWYHCLYNGLDVSVQLYYPSAVNESLKNAQSVSQVLGAIAADAPTPASYSASTYKRVYERTLTLADAAVQAYVFELREVDRTTYTFVKDGVLVHMYAQDSGGALSDSFWKSFTLKKYP